ncbi:hypothetical protein QVD17_29989 [Tagetes erecta]|uniref:Protein kinase domain-containing protein n=1 Tax=Tagetes erecta TaxID=13708 RepID=A0AAD8K3C3_TARER|nr:hypothetical protein QVD17_29989 [Tagetes erecta]
MALEKYGTAYTRISHTASSSSQNVANLEEMPSHLRAFTERELTKAMKVTKATKIGDGLFGKVCKTVVKSLEHPKHRIEVAVRYCTCSYQVKPTYQEYALQVKVLGAINHPNLVRLIGYAYNARMLVYEHMPNNSVFHHLHSSDITPLSWNMRLKVAHDVACGMAYLHEASNIQVMLGDFSSSNILLDENWNAKLTDIGVAPDQNDERIFSKKRKHPTQYAAPEYFYTGRLTSMCNVWSYGVFLYELITGRHPQDFNVPKGGDILVEWVEPYVKTRNFISIIDPRLEVYSMESVAKLSSIAQFCLASNPIRRPKMSVVLNLVSKIVASISGTLEHPKKDDDPIKDNGKKWSLRALFCF